LQHWDKNVSNKSPKIARSGRTPMFQVAAQKLHDAKDIFQSVNSC